MSGSPTAGWPTWWEWELELSPHLLKRMADRGFSEVDLRLLMEAAVEIHEDDEPCRWFVDTLHERMPWAVIVEPDPEDELLVVITAYPLEER